MWDVAIKTAFVILNCFSRKVNVKIAQLCLTLWNPMDCSLPGSSVHGILQARILEWVAFPFSRGSSQPKDRTQVSCIAGRFLTVWATREAQEYWGRIEAIPSLADLPDLGIEPGSAALQADSLPAEPPGNSAHITLVLCALKAVLCEEFLTNQCICERASQDSGGTFITLDKERVIFWEKRKCGERGTYCCLQKLEGLQSGEKWELLKGQNWSWGQHVGIFLKEGELSWMIPGLATAWWWHLLLQASKQRLLVCVRAWWCSQATLHDRSTVSVCPACAGAVAVWARWRPWASLSSACLALPSLLSHVWLGAFWIAASQAPLSMGLSRQGHWSGLLCPPENAGDPPDPGVWSVSCLLRGWAGSSPVVHLRPLLLPPQGQHGDCHLPF